MAKHPRYSDGAVNAESDALLALLDGGRLRISRGTRPSSVDAAEPEGRLLAELRFASPAFEAAVNGVATAHPIQSDEQAEGGGRARWFRAVTAGGDAVLEGTVGLAEADLVLDELEIERGSVVRVSSFVHREPKKE